MPSSSLLSSFLSLPSFFPLLLLFTTLTTLPILIHAYDQLLMLCLVNEERARHGLSSLGFSSALSRAATRHSSDQAHMNTMTHNGSDGSSPSNRITQAGYVWKSAAENVAYGYLTEQKCMKEWMASPGHRANILSGKYTHFGSAMTMSSNGVPYYTQDFGGDKKKHSFPVCPGGKSYGTTTTKYGGGTVSYSRAKNGGSSPRRVTSGARHQRKPATRKKQQHKGTTRRGRMVYKGRRRYRTKPMWRPASGNNHSDSYDGDEDSQDQNQSGNHQQNDDEES